MRTSPPHPVNRGGLAAMLTTQLRGEVRFDSGSRALYATDASNYRQRPLGVVIPRDIDDVVAAVEICRRFAAPIFARGGGTSLAGQCCNDGVVLDFSRYVNRVLAVDAEQRWAVVEPGVVLDDLRAAAEEHGLTFGPDPATHSHCTLGGMIGNNSCGVHSILAGRTSDNVLELEVLTYDGVRMWVGPTSDVQYAAILDNGGRPAEIHRALRDLRDRYAELIRGRYPDIPRRVSGYNLDDLLPERNFDVARALVGSESTCVLVLAARLRLVPSPPARRTLLLGYPDGAAAADAVPQVMAHHPIGLEGFDDVLVGDVQARGLHPDGVALLPAGGGWLLAEFGADTDAEAEAAAQTCRDALGNDTARLLDADQAPAVWAVRESGLGAAARVPGQADTHPGWEDAAVDPVRLGDYLREFRTLTERYGYHAALYGHFGQGCVHTRISFDLVTADGVSAFRSFLTDAAQLCVKYGGSLSGEHGDGQARAALLPIMYGTELVAAFGQFKRIWDPDGRMNPGKVVDPYAVDDNLRYGSDYRPLQLTTFFTFPDDGGDFSRAADRCVGVGNCRQHEGALMCPSYQATGEEQHSTRGRARLLFEMLNGAHRDQGWRDEAVKDALDLCLACKGCKSECPVNVDMATYKAEFFAHYYARRLRPPAAYSMGLLMYSARAAALAPGVVNALTQAAVTARVLKRAAGVHPDREVPVFAPRTFRSGRQAGGKPAGQRVLLWPDTWNDHFHPPALHAGARVLEAAGFTVDLPARWVCCGRPLYDWGMLGQARRLLRRTLRVLGSDIDAGVPVIGLEPSCVSVFRDELPALLPHDRRAGRLAAQTYTLPEWLAKAAPDFAPPIDGSVLVQGHCHDKSVLDFAAETDLLRRCGAQVETPEDGCCGMAGAFGFEARNYQVSMRCADRALLPAVTRAASGTALVADGFSCREQIRQGSGRAPQHVAELLAQALKKANR
ncbi:MAG: FAD-binding oxidoreductase [Actinomycetota bacterium]|nr:FAD-binding oxidoreductase [Actinomycetota bacterium]